MARRPGLVGFATSGKKIEPAVAAAPTLRPKSVWLRRSTRHAELQVPVIELLSAEGATLETGEAPSAEALIVVTPIGCDLTSAVVDLKLEAEHGGNRPPVRHEGATHPNGDANY
jgi:hypothetical protein